MPDHLANKSDALRAKLAALPAEPGVYFHRDAKGKIIYVGKAAVLKHRVMSYFRDRHDNPKTILLVADIADTEWITVGSEIEALFLESEFIKRYKPKYNIDLKDDKNWLYVKVSADPFPVLSYVRRPMDDRAHYYGPFANPDALRRALRALRKVFPYVTHENWPGRACLHYHIGLCPGPEIGAITLGDYRKTIRQLELYLKGQPTKLMAQLEHDMQRAATKRNYEAAAHYRDQLSDLRSFSQKMIFGDREAFDLTRDQSLAGLTDLLGLPKPPRRIEAYDISHLGGADNVASMVVFTDGAPHRDEYRRFKLTTPGNNDTGHMREALMRRFSPKHLIDWPKPDLLLIDGGQPQLAAALSVLDELGLAIPAIGLAKREEAIIQRVSARSDGGQGPGGAMQSPGLESLRSYAPDNRIAPPGRRPAAAAEVPSPSEEDSTPSSAYDRRDSKREGALSSSAPRSFTSTVLPPDSVVLQLCQRIRDEAHRFAINYQTILRGKRATTSLLDGIPGIGPATRKALIRRFGSVRGVKLATLDELSQAIGPAKATAVREALGEAVSPKVL